MLAQDVGCCFGQELRKAILDGYPEADTVASDLTSDYWCVLGHVPFTPVPFCVVIWVITAEDTGTLACQGESTWRLCAHRLGSQDMKAVRKHYSSKARLACQ